MLGLGFAPQIDKLKDLLLTSAAEAGRKRPQVALFTATMPQQVRAVADAWLRLPKRIIVAASGEGDKEGQGNGTGEQGGAGTISPTVVQVVQVCADHKKAAKLLKHMEAVKAAAAGQRHAPRVLIFANRIKRVRFIAKLLEREGYRTAELHGQRSQEERQEAIRAFKSGKAQVLVASDVAARGLDIKNLPYVVNYDFPSNVETYVHRVGRTGRLAADGHAFSFMTREVAPLAQPLLDLLQAHDQPVDPNLVKLAEAYAIAAKKLSIEPSSAAAAVSRAKPEGNEDEEDEEERVALRPATEDVLKELNLKTKAQKKRDKAAEKTREKKRKAREEVADHASSDDGGDSDEQPSGTAATARLPVGDAPHAEFLAAKRFAGAKPGYVFKRGGMGVGYYLDRPPHLAAKARALELKKAKAKASMKPIGGEAVGRAPTKVSAKAPVTKKPVPLLPGRMKQLKKARGDSSGESSEDEGGAHGAVARRKPLPGRLRKKLAREKAGAGRKGGAA